MKAIFTKVYGDHRIKATDHDGNSAIVDRASERQYEEQHDDAARALCDRMNWHGTLVKAYWMRASVTVGRIYVWINVKEKSLMLTKLALKRDPTVPVGQPAPLHLDCPCGTVIPVVAPVQTCAGCGQSYDARG